MLKNFNIGLSYDLGRVTIELLNLVKIHNRRRGYIHITG